MTTFRHPADGDTRPCPQCRNTLVFSSRYPVLAVGMALARPGSEVGRAHPVRASVGLPQWRL